MRRSICRRSREFAFAGLLVALPAVAGAQTTGQAVYAGSPNEVTLSVNVRASVSASCSFIVGAMPKGSYSLGDLKSSYSLDIPFNLTCNSPSRVGIVSDNGGMLAASVPKDLPGYSNHAPYLVMLRLAGDAGSSAQATCESPTLTAGASGCVFRGPATSTAGLRLPGPSQGRPGSFIRISSPSEPREDILVASDYADRLTVTISPAS